MVNTAANAPVRSPFEGHATGNRPNAAGQIGVQISAGMLPSFTLISTWVSGLPGLLDALTAVFGDTVPQRIGKATRTELGLLARSGPEGVSLSEVARLAGVNRGTAYQHFDTREGLIEATVATRWRRLAQGPWLGATEFKIFSSKIKLGSNFQRN